MDITDSWWLLPIFGFLIGILASLTGVGGGVFIVPILTLFYGFVIQAATGTSLTTIIFTAIASTVNYAKQKRIYFRTGAVLAITTVPGAYLGAEIATRMEPRLLGLIFGVFLILVAARAMIDALKKKPMTKMQEVKTDAELIRSRNIMPLGIGLGFFGGIASGLLGIGGGTLIVPIIAFVLGMPIHYATATSMFTMIFTSISAVAKYYQSNLVDFPVALVLAAGSIFGAQVGAYTSKKLSSRNLTLVFAVILIVAGVNMLIKYR